MGGVFWLLLWGWLLIPRERIKVPEEGDLITRSQSSIKLQGFRVRQETRRTDGSTTYLEIQAEKGWNMEEIKDSHVLVNVEVRLVPKRNLKSAMDTEGIENLSAQSDIAWVLIQAATGIWSVRTRNIDLMGNVQIFGYSLGGELTEWIAADKIFYGQQENTVRSISPATYEGRSSPIGRAYRGFVETDVDLNEINITELETLPDDFPTPFQHPEMRPPYSPPEALRFLQEASHAPS